MRGNRTRNTFLAVAALVAIGMVVLLRGYTFQVTRADENAQAASVGLGVVLEVQQACAAEDDDPDATAIRDAGLCDTADQAEKVIEQTPTDIEPKTGATGAAGATGPRGPTGFGIPGQDGEDGRSPTAGQILAAVAAYCSSRNDCAGATGGTGAAGKDGTNGTNGSDAPRITNITCDGTTGRFEFSDDSVIEVANMCQPGLIPEPEPTS